MNQRLLKIEVLITLTILIFFSINTSNTSWGAVRKPYSKKKQSVISHKRSTITDDSIHIVRKGETLYRIAKMNGLSVSEIKELNSLKNNKLKIGQRLILKPKADQQPGIFSQLEEVKDSVLSQVQDGISIDEGIYYNYVSEVEELDDSLTGRVLLYARDLLGVPYRFGGATLRAIDCSAFVQKVFRSIGIDLPRTAREQFKIGREVDRDDIAKGDLVFFKTYSRYYPSHVGIYIGDNYFIHASTKKRKVRIDSLDEPYYSNRFIGAKRLIEAEAPTQSSDDGKSS